MINGNRCPSCGTKLGPVLNIRYQGSTTKVRFQSPDEVDEHGEPVELEHVCGDHVIS